MAIKLLLVEDNPVVQRLYDVAFTIENLEVITANDGQEALKLARSERPDVIIMDIMMPKMNGLEALQVLKSHKQTKAIPVIILTAFEEETLVQQALQLGAAHYLLKGATEPDEIATIIRQVVATHPGA
jgi:CheY-like chemotaxis protein